MTLIGRTRQALALCFALLPLGAGAQPAAPARSEAPIRFVRLSDGTPRFSVSITIAGTPVDAGLDSGSTGLRVLPGVVPGSATAKGRHTGYGYQSGTHLDGVLADEPLTIGQPAIGGTAPVQLVQSVDCTPGFQGGRCPGVKVAFDQFGIQGDGLPGEGFKAILGVNMGSDTTPNPLIRLGVRRWIIELSRPGDSAPGRLILNPTDEETKDYKLFHLDHTYVEQSGLHDAVLGCVEDLKNKRSFCGSTLLDTGAPGIVVISQDSEAAFPAGDPGQIVFLDGAKPALAAQFDYGDRDLSSRFTTHTRPRIRGNQLFVGVMPYYAFSVLYDPSAGAVGLKAR